jgi:hypothetical protein
MVTVIVRFTDEQVARLAEHKKLTGCATSEFIRRAVDAALERLAGEGERYSNGWKRATVEEKKSE